MTTVIEEPTQERANRYSLVVLAAKRAKQLKEGAPFLIDTASTNLLTVALEEIAAGKVTHIAAVETEDDDEVPAHVVTAPPVAQTFLSPSQPSTNDTKNEPIPAELAAFLGSDDTTDELSEEDEDAEEVEEDDEEAEDDLIEKA